MPTFAAWSYKNAIGHPVNYPDNKLDYCARFLKMMFALPGQDYEVDPVVADALINYSFMLITSKTVYINGANCRSSKASIYSSISGSINALCGYMEALTKKLQMLETSATMRQ